jgi:hypothetical protein
MLTQLDQLLDAIKADYGRWSKNLTSPRQEMIDEFFAQVRVTEGKK